MIAEARALLAELLTAPPLTLNDEPVPVYQWLPLRTNELPCVVVGRPSLTEGEQRAIVQISTPVWVLGRTTRDEDAQQQLDQLADQVFARLYWVTPNRSGMASRMTDLDATTLTVAELDDVPAYTAAIISTTTICP